MNRYISFDLETSKITPDGDDIQLHRPLGIACWAIAVVKNDGTIGTVAGHGEPLITGKAPPPQMPRDKCQLLVRHLQATVGRGNTLLTHNGVGFDFDILAEESGMHAECAALAMNSVDTCFHIHCHKGFPVGLEAIAAGMGLQGKTEGMSGALAPQMWAEGEYDKVLEYVAQDARSTLEIALAIEQRGSLRWISKKGRINSLAVPRWLTVTEALQLPEPDTSWMSEPMPRSRFVGWMDGARV